MHRPLRS